MGGSRKQRRRRARAASEDSAASGAPAKKRALEEAEAEAEGPRQQGREQTLLKSIEQLQVPGGVANLKKTALKKRRIRSQGVSNATQVEATVEEQCETWGFDAQVATNLRSLLHIDRFFAIQVRAISKFLASSSDLCISAPTGSGKTLIFAVPIVASLTDRIVQRLRALILLPTRELALQCRSVLDALCADTKLIVASSVGQTSFEQDQGLVRACDILVCTPGRLIDHLKLTSDFTLEHLNFFVVDEADRLLSQRYQGWLEKIYEAAFSDRPGRATWNSGLLHLRTSSIRRQFGSSVASHRFDEPALRRVLCSATLTRNPAQLAALNLRRPIYVTLQASQEGTSGSDNGAAARHEAATEVVQRPEAVLSEGRDLGFALPESLIDHTLVCRSEQKPFALVQLVKSFKGAPALVFAASVEATHRLAVFLRLLLGDTVAEISSSQAQSKRSSILAKLDKGVISTVIVSDVMARGIDLEKLQNVVNYDIPGHVKAYVHRVGRVARAGRAGNSFTILQPNQRKQYSRMRAKLAHRDPVPVDFDEALAEELSDKVTQSLSRMKTTVKDEARAKRRGR